jgi:hypothetical protein
LTAELGELPPELAKDEILKDDRFLSPSSAGALAPGRPTDDRDRDCLRLMYLEV